LYLRTEGGSKCGRIKVKMGGDLNIAKAEEDARWGRRSGLLGGFYEY